MRHNIVKWYPLFIVCLILTGSYLYNLYTPWGRYWLDGEEFWYQLSWKGEKVGYVQVSYDRLDNDIFQIKQFTRVNTINRGEAVTFVEEEIFQFEDNDSGPLVSLNYHRQQNDYLEQTQLDKKNNALQGVKQIDNHSTNITLSLNNYSLADHLALMHWSSGSLNMGDTLDAKRLDLGELAIKPVIYTKVKNIQLKEGLTVKFEEEGKSWMGTVELNSIGTPEVYAVGQQVEQLLSTKEQALSDNSFADYYRSQVISVDKPLGTAVRLTSLILESPFTDTDIINDERQFISTNGELHLKKASSSKDVEITDVHTYSINTGVDGLIIALAENIVGNSTSDYEKVGKLLTFVSSYLKDAPVIRPMSVSTILKQRKGDCTEHTELFLALARAVSIPAREVKGLVYLGDEVQGFGGHVWGEVIIDNKWVAVDPTWNLQQLSATHIQFNNNRANKIFNDMHKNAKFVFTLKSAEYL